MNKHQTNISGHVCRKLLSAVAVCVQTIVSMATTWNILVVHTRHHVEFFSDDSL